MEGSIMQMWPPPISRGSSELKQTVSYTIQETSFEYVMLIYRAGCTLTYGITKNESHVYVHSDPIMLVSDSVSVATQQHSFNNIVLKWQLEKQSSSKT
jgi:hypothetical protein